MGFSSTTSSSASRRCAWAGARGWPWFWSVSRRTQSARRYAQGPVFVPRRDRIGVTMDDLPLSVLAPERGRDAQNEGFHLQAIAHPGLPSLGLEDRDEVVRHVLRDPLEA